MRLLNECINEGLNTQRSDQHHRAITNSLRQNAVVTPEEYRYIETEIKKALEAPTPGRILMGITGPVGLVKTAYQYDKDTHMSEAIISHYFEGNRDLVDTARTTVEIPIIQKNFRMNRRDLEASRSTPSTNLDIRNARSALYRVKKAETTLIVQGWAMDGTNYDVSGLYTKVQEQPNQPLRTLEPTGTHRQK